jgi:NAD(P)-dependent dehydrogenase (short-subunit alcohol dehydrogenase family)
MVWIRSHHRCLVTGGSAGIGLETARGLARLGAKITITGRNPERTEAAALEIAESTGNDRVDFELADFSSLTEVRDLAERIRRAGELHVLVNNAGLWHPERTESRDGFEDTFAVNHLAPFLLTNLLLEVMTSATHARVVTVSSRLHIKAKGIAFDDIHLRQSYKRKGLAAYEHSKLANVLFSNELARRLPPNVTSNAVHPGGVATSVTRQSRLAAIGQWFLRPFLLTPVGGARTSLHVATSANLEHVTGKYFSDQREEEPSPAARDEAAAARLWDLSAKLTELDS